MKIVIKYCGMWGYKSRAQDVADEILGKYDNLEVFLEVGSGGQFDIIYQTDPPGLLFSKDVKDRFPNPGEILEIMEKYNG